MDIQTEHDEILQILSEALLHMKSHLIKINLIIENRDISEIPHEVMERLIFDAENLRTGIEMIEERLDGTILFAWTCESLYCMDRVKVDDIPRDR